MIFDADQLKADRAAGTPGPWELRKIAVPCMSADDREAWEIVGADGVCVTDNQDYYPDPLSLEDMRRVARLDALEAAYIAQRELLEEIKQAALYDQARPEWLLGVLP